MNDLLDSKTGTMTRKQLFQRHILEFDNAIFDQAVLTLETAGFLKRHYEAGGEETFVITEFAKQRLRGD